MESKTELEIIHNFFKNSVEFLEVVSVYLDAKTGQSGVIKRLPLGIHNEINELGDQLEGWIEGITK